MIRRGGLLYWLIFFLAFFVIWIGMDFIFSLLRTAVWVFAKAFKSALYSAVITTIVFSLIEHFRSKDDSDR